MCVFFLIQQHHQMDCCGNKKMFLIIVKKLIFFLSIVRKLISKILHEFFYDFFVTSWYEWDSRCNCRLVYHHSTEILSKLFEFAIDEDEELPPSRFLSFWLLARWEKSRMTSLYVASPPGSLSSVDPISSFNWWRRKSVTTSAFLRGWTTYYVKEAEREKGH